MTGSCQETLDRLVEAATGSLPPGERAWIAGHLAVCDSCRQEAAGIEELAALLRDEGRVIVPPGFWPGFMRRLGERIASDRPPLASRALRWLASPLHALGTAALTAGAVFAVMLAVRTVPLPPQPYLVDARARGLVTQAMAETLPSLGELLETWRAGLPAGSDAPAEQVRR